MTTQTISYVLSSWGAIVGALLGQFAGAVIRVYHEAFTRDALRTAFMVGMLASLVLNTWIAVTVGTTIVGFVVDFSLGTLAGSMVAAAGRLAWDIVSDTLGGTWRRTKEWVNDLWTEFRWRLTGEVAYVRPDIRIYK